MAWKETVEEIARRNGTTFQKAIAKGWGHWAYIPVRVEMAKALRAQGFSSTRIAMWLNRDHTTILGYIGPSSKLTRTQALVRIAELEAERDRLRQALEPFAEAAELTDDLAAGHALDEIMLSLSVGDLRRARAALRARPAP